MIIIINYYVGLSNNQINKKEDMIDSIIYDEIVIDKFYLDFGKKALEFMINNGLNLLNNNKIKSINDDYVCSISIGQIIPNNMELNKYYHQDFLNLISKILFDYEINYKINTYSNSSCLYVKSNLDKLIYLYYMEIQRFNYLNNNYLKVLK